MRNDYIGERLEVENIVHTCAGNRDIELLRQQHSMTELAGRELCLPQRPHNLKKKWRRLEEEK